VETATPATVDGFKLMLARVVAVIAREAVRVIPLSDAEIVEYVSDETPTVAIAKLAVF